MLNFVIFKHALFIFVKRGKNKRVSYTESVYAGETQKYSIQSKLNDPKFEQSDNDLFCELEGKDLTLEYFQRNGFTHPLVVRKNQNNGKLL